MKKYFKILFPAFAVLLLAAGCNKTQPQDRPAPLTTAAQAPAERPVGQMQTRQNAGKPDYTPGFVIVSDTVEGSNLNHQYDKVKEGTTAFDLLDSTHKVTAKDYGAGMGKMVLSIDGTTPDSQHYWGFYVNGKSSNVGASAYALKDGDKVEWKLEAISNYKE
ncbi:MAG: DUF4430 domain-containing protein [Patescibacteria group bacterium]|nr:DUF4430 domain-containing protein [Patescibacteria group bacterium]